MTNGVTSFNGPLRTSQNLGVEIARGRMAGSQPAGSSGRYEASGGEVNHIIWPNGAYKIPPVGGVDLTIVSDSADDIAGGTGVQELEVHYLDLELNPVSVTIEMNGLTPIVDAITDVRFVQCMHVSKTGTNGQGAVGEITAKEGAQIYAMIGATETRCRSSARMVPNGKRAMVAGAVSSSISGTAAARAEISIVATELDDHQYTDQGLFIPYSGVGVQDGPASFNLPVPLPFKEGTVIALMVSVDKSAIITGAWFGWFEDK